MDDEARRVKIRRFVEAINTGEMEPFDAIYHDDVVVHWPQSGEVIRGKHKIREFREAYPTPPKATLRRIVGSGDLWAIEMGSTTTATGSMSSSSTSGAMGWW
jgi:ketosteroid isomerase-like protein